MVAVRVFVGVAVMVAVRVLVAVAVPVVVGVLVLLGVQALPTIIGMIWATQLHNPSSPLVLLPQQYIIPLDARAQV